MKYFFYLVLLFYMSCSIFKRKKKDMSQEKPPGTMWFNDSLFVDETEVSNQHWLDYENYFKNKKLNYSHILI